MPSSPKRHAEAASDDPLVRARGTRQQMPLTRGADAGTRGDAAARGPDAGTRGAAKVEPVRDPLEVLRMWPHSTGMYPDPSVPSRATLPAPGARRVFEDKIVLAHLALELFREVDELHETTRDARPGRPDPVAPCDNPSCAARTSALRGALVEACLLVQRAVLMSPPSAAKTEIDASVRGLLGRLER